MVCVTIIADVNGDNLAPWGIIEAGMQVQCIADYLRIFTKGCLIMRTGDIIRTV